MMSEDGVMCESTGPVTRPRLVARRRAFLDAANAAFLDKGYGNTTLDDIIARSGGSRQTLYSLFGGKQGLFEALVNERSRQIFERFYAKDLLDRPPADVLVDLGIHYLEVVTTPDALGMYRLVLAEGTFMKELAERFWDAGPERARTLLADYFEKQILRGTLRMKSPEQAAQQFWGMLLGNFHLKCLLGLRESPGPEEIEAFVRTAVSWFLDGCRGQKG
jgi:TetR/AcrR family transcriptional regulator, mexJK operon transcriptional repressor